MKTYLKIGKAECPLCGYKIDSATQAHGDQGKPSDGAVSVCVNCGGLGIYRDDLSIRLITNEELQDLIRDWEAWATIERAQVFIRARGRFA